MTRTPRISYIELGLLADLCCNHTERKIRWFSVAEARLAKKEHFLCGNGREKRLVVIAFSTVECCSPSILSRINLKTKRFLDVRR